jgi:hypothetical protein
VSSRTTVVDPRSIGFPKGPGLKATQKAAMIRGLKAPAPSVFSEYNCSTKSRQPRREPKGRTKERPLRLGEAAEMQAFGRELPAEAVMATVRVPV